MSNNWSIDFEFGSSLEQAQPKPHQRSFKPHWRECLVEPRSQVFWRFLIGEHTKLSTLYVFFAVLGGLKTFGGVGVFIGPLVLAVAVALFRFLREEKRAGMWSLEEDGG